MIKILWSKHVLVSICVYAVFLFFSLHIYISKFFLYISVLFPHLSFFLYTSSTSVKTWSAASDDNLSTKCNAYICMYMKMMNNSRLFFSPGKPLLQGLLLMMTINLSTKCNMYVYVHEQL